jgi:hypothetical protein
MVPKYLRIEVVKVGERKPRLVVTPHTDGQKMARYLIDSVGAQLARQSFDDRNHRNLSDWAAGKSGVGSRHIDRLSLFYAVVKAVEAASSDARKKRLAREFLQTPNDSLLGKRNALGVLVNCNPFDVIDLLDEAVGAFIKDRALEMETPSINPES